MAGQSWWSMTFARTALLAVLVASGSFVVAHPGGQTETGAPLGARTYPPAETVRPRSEAQPSDISTTSRAEMVNSQAPTPMMQTVSARRKRPAARTSGVRRPSSRKPRAVSPTAPVRIDIGPIGVSAPIDPLGRNRNRTLAVPKNFQRAGYYTGGAKPGEVGPAVIVAHVNSKRGPAVFARLHELQPGAEVVVTRADGSRIAFVVDQVERHPKKAFPTAKVYGPTPTATLRLITCGGSFNRASGHYRDNYIAFAHLRGPA